MTLKEFVNSPDTMDLSLRYDEKLANYVVRKRLCTNKQYRLW
jgi:hypothetical protein